MRIICRGSTRIQWLPDGYAQTREALERCSIDLALSCAEVDGFRAESPTHELTFYEDEKSMAIRDVLQEDITGTVAIYDINAKDHIEWWNVEVAGLGEGVKRSEESWPTWKVTFRSI